MPKSRLRYHNNLSYASFFNLQIHHEVQDLNPDCNLDQSDHLPHGATGQRSCYQSVYCQSAYSAGSTMSYLLQWRHLQQYPDTDVQNL